MTYTMEDNLIGDLNSWHKSRAWSKIVEYKKPVIQGVLNVAQGNLCRVARPPGGGFCVCRTRHRRFL